MSSLLVFDIDNTLSLTEDHVIPAFVEGVYACVKRERPEMVREVFAEASLKAYHEHGCSVVGLAQLLGKGPEWVMDVVGEISPRLFEAVVKQVQPDAELKLKLQDLQRRGHTLVALTQGHQAYCLPLLKHLELDGIFPDHMVHDFVAVQGHLKRSEEPYRHVLNSHADKVYLAHHMVEDSPANLPAAKRMGFTTWMVGPKPVKDGDAPLIDHRHADIHGVLDAMLAV